MMMNPRTILYCASLLPLSACQFPVKVCIGDCADEESDSMHDVTATSVRSALDNGLKVDTGGLTPTLRWRFTARLAAIGFPRLVNADVTLQTVRQGRLVAARRGFEDMTKTLESADLD